MVKKSQYRNCQGRNLVENRCSMYFFALHSFSENALCYVTVNVIQQMYAPFNNFPRQFSLVKDHQKRTYSSIILFIWKARGQLRLCFQQPRSSNFISRAGVRWLLGHLYGSYSVSVFPCAQSLLRSDLFFGFHSIISTEWSHMLLVFCNIVYGQQEYTVI